MQKIGRYEILDTIGSGGMGEVLLAYDPICKRKIALKKIKPEISKNISIKKRFLKEAKIASRLTHPSIVPIYSIHADDNITYYTMPYVEGKTLKTILEKEERLKNSIPNLIRIFLRVCEAVAYTHSNNILHKDLKPNNILVGKYGEVLILDWGIANFIDENPKTPEKISGTVAFMPPEKAKGEPSSILTDIYSLGVILYQILTLQSPFQRHNLAYFKKFFKKEILIDPIEKAPHRDIPHILSEITKKCLHPDKKKRYQKTEEIIKDLKNYIEGKPKWIFVKNLNIEKKEDWVFNENLFLAKHTAITQNNDLSNWAHVMIAKTSLWQNIKITAKISFQKNSEGIGFLISIPKDPHLLDDGYCLWIGKNQIQLIRSGALVMEVQKKLKTNVFYEITIEKEENNFHLFINDTLILSHITHIPLTESNIGFFFKDLNFSMKDIKIYSSSLSATVNCLAIPNAFLAKKDYNTAYVEYKKIASSFPGRTEGIHALFQAGITLLEKSKKKLSFQKALDEFELLKKTPGAPLEYLGKSLVYATMLEYEEEAKCLELAIRKFSKHPLISTVKEHIFYRIHETALQNREATYRLVLLALLYLPSIIKRKDISILLKNLQRNLEKVYFLSSAKHDLAIDLAFRLNQKRTLLEIFSKTKDAKTQNNILFALLELGEIDEVKKYNNDPLIDFCLKAKENILEKFLENFSENFSEKSSKKENFLKAYTYIINYRLDNDLEILNKAFEIALPKNIIDPLHIKYLLQKKDFKKAEEIFSKYPQDILCDENSSLFPLYAIYLFSQNKKNIVMDNFSKMLEVPYPKTPSLLGYYLTKKLNDWEDKAFFFERKELRRQISLLSKFYAIK